MITLLSPFSLSPLTLAQYLDIASNGFYYQLEGNQGWKKKVSTDGDFAGTHHHYHNIPSVRGQKPIVSAVPLIPQIPYQTNTRNLGPMNSNPLQSMAFSML
ncbi:unnamed protein product [Thelazia callipaeda]|uniref:Fork-head domain-containing protein n=1 Tax=Thelazia callipaeda TaxID=103827 RepID=A0A0N5D813_THECL|nr:unnamed protein product [Thelazia callipaeda]